MFPFGHGQEADSVSADTGTASRPWSSDIPAAAAFQPPPPVYSPAFLSHSGGASGEGRKQPGCFLRQILRQIKSKASLSALNKRAAEKKENVPPMPPVPGRFHIVHGAV